MMNLGSLIGSRSLRGLLAGTALAAAALSYNTAQASAITGTIAFTAAVAETGGVNLAAPGAVYTFTGLAGAGSIFNVGPGSAGFSGVAPFTSFSSSTLDLGNLSAYSFSSPTFGTFTANVVQLITTQDAANLNIFLEGMFSPGPLLGSPPAELASAHVSLNQSGGDNGTISLGISFADPPSPPPGVPEPATLALFGASLAGFGFLRRRKAQ